MQGAIDELQKSLRYHTRQLEENLTEIMYKEQAIEMLKEKNETHKQTIKQLNKAIEVLSQ